MNFHELQKRAKELSIENVLKDLEGKKVPISDNEEVLVMDTNRKEITFERELNSKEENYFNEWLGEKIQEEISDQLGF